ncbi:unnamed protein product [Linum trigynum]|uniref:Uncharacterized protein n=1 Tax=Linum trigynum TaxID=586398 RepID=A0AAV2D8V2_9ROSI
MQSMKETASNIGASAKGGMEKTKATVQEKIEKASAHDPVQKEMAREKKEERVADSSSALVDWEEEGEPRLRVATRKKQSVACEW